MSIVSRLLRLPEVQAVVPLSRSAIYSKIAAGEFPKPVEIGDRASALLESDISAWIQNRVISRAA